MKKGLAVLLAVLLMFPSAMPAAATEIATETEIGTETEVETEVETETETEVETEVETETETEVETEVEVETESEIVVSDKILFNTGNCEWSITDENGDGDDYFAEDGSYTIYIPEANPFFPYEVQFTHNGEVTTEWFMTPDDSVTIDDHTFYVVGQFDNETVTQMTLNVGGDTVIVYPEKKEFTNDGGMQTYSLLPLEEKYLSVDLTSYTPVELTMVSVEAIFTGENALEDTEYLMWTHTYDDDFKVNVVGDKLDFSSGGSYQTWQMIVGDKDQLAADNVRYVLNISTTSSSDWLTSIAYTQDEMGNRTAFSATKDDYSVSSYNGYQMYFYVPSDEANYSNDIYVSYALNTELYPNVNFTDLKVYEGCYTNPEEAMAATNITTQFMCTDMTQSNAGYPVRLYNSKEITFVAFDGEGKVIGCLPVIYRVYSAASNYFNFSIFKRDENGRTYVAYSSSVSHSSLTSKSTYTAKLFKEYAADEKYFVEADYYMMGESNNDAVTAYLGTYTSIAEAVAAGATDVTEQMFEYSYSYGGYEDVFHEGIDFTFFVGADDDVSQKIFYYNIKTETSEYSNNEGEDNNTPSAPSTPILSSSTYLNIYSLRDKEGRYVDCYVVGSQEDSYAEYNYLTILVPEDTDLTNLAPVFDIDSGAKLYTAGSSAPEESGVSIHDFSNGPIQYTVSAEDGETSKNYWLNVIAPKEGVAELYINSLFDESANVREENGIVYATREVMLDGYHNDIHDIFVTNVGTEDLKNLSVTLQSDVIALDQYWTLSGNYDLSGFTSVYDNSSYGELENFAKIRLVKKEGVEAGTEITGTLTIKSGETTLAVLELTGLIGDPIITTEEVPATVKYVPYGTMIQNNNKYSWNKISYDLWGGTLPNGMELKSNGEIYGVPTETGEFVFSVYMNNSNSSFSDDIVDYVLTITENTTENVDAATDEGYQLSERIVALDTTAAKSQTLVSQGEYAEFVDVYIDGIKLIADKDYTSEEGSTRITISSQTLAEAGDQTQNTHTIGIEFRTSDVGALKRAAQNYEIKSSSTNGGNTDGGNNNSGNGSTGGGNNNSGNGSTGNGNIDLGGNTGSGNNNFSDGNYGGGFEMITTPVAHHIAGPEETTSYVISSGDTLWSIAVKYYGSGNYWKHIFEANRNIISDPNKIFTGQTISLTPVMGTGSNAANNNAVSAEGTYTIVSGDNLWKIAKKVYGKGWKWRQIYEANTTIISDPGQIYVGQVIQIPTE